MLADECAQKAENVKAEYRNTRREPCEKRPSLTCTRPVKARISWHRPPHSLSCFFFLLEALGKANSWNYVVALSHPFDTKPGKSDLPHDILYAASAKAKSTHAISNTRLLFIFPHYSLLPFFPSTPPTLPHTHTHTELLTQR